jgi:hypothetical protein
VFNSDWPSLTIAYEQTITVQAGDNTIDHNLGFVPLVMGWLSLNGVCYGRIPNLESGVNTALLEGVAPYIGTTVTIRCYNIDITQEASYPLPTGAAAKQAPDYTTFVKVVKQGRGINSKNLNDFVINSLAQAPAVLDVATQAGQYFQTTNTGYAIVYPLQTSYIPWVIGAVGLGGNTRYHYYTPSDLSYADGAITMNFGEVGDVASLIVLRDPLFYPNTVRVVY